MPGVKMAAEGGSEGRVRISERPVPALPGGMLTRDLPIGLFSWRARIGSHADGADPADQ